MPRTVSAYLLSTIVVSQENVEKLGRGLCGFWLLSTTILFLINYRAYLPHEINRNIQQGLMPHVAGFLIGFVMEGWRHDFP